jgi:hypothetical protein
MKIPSSPIIFNLYSLSVSLTRRCFGASFFVSLNKKWDSWKTFENRFLHFMNINASSLEPQWKTSFFFQALLLRTWITFVWNLRSAMMTWIWIYVPYAALNIFIFFPTRAHGRLSRLLVSFLMVMSSKWQLGLPQPWTFARGASYVTVNKLVLDSEQGDRRRGSKGTRKEHHCV